MKYFNKLLILLLSFFCTYCVPVKYTLVGEENLKTNAEEMQVIGKNALKAKTQIQFGTFYTSKFKKGWIKGGTTQINEITRGIGWHFNSSLKDYSTLNNQFVFKQYNQLGDSIEVLCSADMQSTTTHYPKNITSKTILDDSYQIRLFYEGREFYVDYKDKATSYFVNVQDTLKIEYKYQFDQKTNQLFQGVIFKRADKAIAALGEEIIWMDKNLNNKDKLLIAALSTAILMKPNLAQI